jgi:hypothetical protein
LGALSHEAKFKQDAKNKVIALKKPKRTFKDVTRGDPWAPSLTKQNLNRTQNHEVFAA